MKNLLLILSIFAYTALATAIIPTQASADRVCTSDGIVEVCVDYPDYYQIEAQASFFFFRAKDTLFQ